MTTELRTELKYTRIEVTAKDMPLHCPMPSMKLWNTHPRVYIPIEEITAVYEDLDERFDQTPFLPLP